MTHPPLGVWPRADARSAATRTLGCIAVGVPAGVALLGIAALVVLVHTDIGVSF